MNINVQKVKIIVFFIVSVVILFYIGHKLAREEKVNFTDSQTESAFFLEIITGLNAIQFDIDFINSLSAAAITSGNSAPKDVPQYDTGRENPFTKHDASKRGSNRIVPDLESYRENVSPLTIRPTIPSERPPINARERTPIPGVVPSGVSPDADSSRTATSGELAKQSDAAATQAESAVSDSKPQKSSLVPIPPTLSR